MKILEFFIDGACSGNPGEASVGIVVKKDDKVLKEISESIGPATNNIAEYMALIFALQEALILRTDNVKVFTDSELLYHQIHGHYKVKNPHLKPLFVLIQHLLKGFGHFEIKHIPREKNRDADKLAKQALKKRQVKMVAPGAYSGEESPSSQG